MNTHRYSEIFKSIQGEGQFTGMPTLWLRVFGCSLECKGFGQVDPTDPSTYEFDVIDASKIKSITDFGVVSRGCDSVYSVSKDYKDLQFRESASVIANKMVDLSINQYNTEGDISGFDLCFTGGEPLLKKNQKCISEVVTELRKQRKTFNDITIETNGTQMLTEDFLKADIDPFMSISPKLFSVSGELPAKAIHLEVIAQYAENFRGQLKFVCSGTEECWDEIAELLPKIRAVGCNYPVYIMPLGGTIEGQRGEIDGHMDAGTIADEAIERGYRVAARVHNYLWQNAVGK